MRRQMLLAKSAFLSHFSYPGQFPATRIKCRLHLRNPILSFCHVRRSISFCCSFFLRRRRRSRGYQTISKREYTPMYVPTAWLNPKVSPNAVLPCACHSCRCITRRLLEKGLLHFIGARRTPSGPPKTVLLEDFTFFLSRGMMK